MASKLIAHLAAWYIPTGRTDLDGMDTLVDVLNRKKLLSADEVEVCERVMALADAFRVGIEYGEAMKNV